MSKPVVESESLLPSCGVFSPPGKAIGLRGLAPIFQTLTSDSP